MKEEWLKCHVEKGMFSGEVVVRLMTADGIQVSHFVPRETVKNDRVAVQVERSQKSRPMAILPTAEPYNAIAVRAEDLTVTP